MANPFVGYESQAAYSGSPTDHMGDDYYLNCVTHVAGLALIALLILVALKVSGFRAMVGVGRG